MEALDLSGRTANGLDPFLDIETPESFSGVGVRAPPAAGDGPVGNLLALEACLEARGFTMPEALLCGVLGITEDGGLFGFVEARKLPNGPSNGPELDAGRLNDLAVEPAD